MGKIHVLPKDAESGQPCLPNELLPLYYMSDHSVMGILVREFKEATLILEKQKWPLTKTAASIEVFFDNAAHMEEIFRVFEKFGLDFEIADILDQVYQG
ncbi:MAG: hypothetical protein PVJ69_00905 [Desulfobacteraceae bacterium]|jgi:hypothetical protein